MKPRVYFPCEAQKVKTILWRHIKWTVLASEQGQALCWACSDILSFSSLAPASQPFPRLQTPISSQPLNKFPLRTPTGTSSSTWWTSPLHPLPTFTSAQVHPARQIGKLFTNLLKPRVLELSWDPLSLLPWAILQWRSMCVHACLSGLLLIAAPCPPRLYRGSHWDPRWIPTSAPPAGMIDPSTRQWF